MDGNLPFLLSINSFIFSPLYISEDKLRQVRIWFRGNTAVMEPLPVNSRLPDKTGEYVHVCCHPEMRI